MCIRDSRQTGEPGALGQSGVILEAFRPGTEPSRETEEEESGLSFARSSVSDDPLALLLSEGSDEEEDEEDEEDEGLGGLY